MSRRKLNKLAKVMGGRDAIAKALGVSEGAVARYFTGKGMRQATRDKLDALMEQHLEAPQAPAAESAFPVSPRIPASDLGPLPEPPTLDQEGSHLLRMMVKCLARNEGVEALGAQLNRMEQILDRIESNQRRAERRLDRIEANQQAFHRAWGMRCSDGTGAPF